MDNKLHTAVRYGNEEEVQAALKAGCDPNQIGLLKWNPVHEAAHNGEREILQLLIFHKGDVNLQDNLHGNTPLHYAAREDNSACVTVLLKAGARTDIKNNEGMTCMDTASSFCKDVIQGYMDGHSSSDWNGVRDDPNNNPWSKNGIRTQDKWENIPSVPEQAAIGHIHLSFEYNKTNLKIRVWQVSDLLLPPPQTSMIESIFVRSYLIPDAAKKTNRRTEDVPVEEHSKERRQSLTIQSGIQHIFTPSSFKFGTPLLYTGVTMDIVKERSLQLEVCMTQKQTGKPFLMAMVHMPLATVVRRPIREKYPLIACMNYTIPNSMRVYSARDIILEGTSSRQSQSLSRSNSSHSSNDSRLTARDIQLEGVDVDKFVRRYISVDLGDTDDDDDEGSLRDIRTSGKKSLTSSTVTVDAGSFTTDYEDPTSLKEVIGHKTGANQSVAIDIQNEGKVNTKKRIIPNELLSKSSSSESENSEKNTSGEKVTEKSTVIKVEEDVKDTVLDMTKLQGDVVLDLTSNDPNKDNKDKSGSQKKKIIPNELLSDAAQGVTGAKQAAGDKNSSQAENSDGASDTSACLYDEIRNDDINSHEESETANIPTVLISNSGDQISEETSQVEAPSEKDQNDNNDDMADDATDEITIEIDRSRLSSEVSSEIGSTTTSRPETPVWDFYDFADEEGEENPEGVDPSDPNAPKDEASKALGTLQASLLRLSQKRNSQVLDTCIVEGPVLPTVMIEDFEMDEESNVEEAETTES